MVPAKETNIKKTSAAKWKTQDSGYTNSCFDKAAWFVRAPKVLLYCLYVK